VRAGAIIPTQPVVQSTNEKPDGPLELLVYPGDNCRGTLYEDDGLTFAYQKGEYLRVNFSCQVASGAVSISSSVAKNAFRPWWTSMKLTVFGVGAQPNEVRVGDKSIHDWRYDNATHSVTLVVADALRDWTVRIGP
jgi:alpha-glucosidase